MSVNQIARIDKRARMLDAKREVLATQEARVHVAPRSTANIRIDSNVATPADATRELIIVGAARWYFAPPLIE